MNATRQAQSAYGNPNQAVRTTRGTEYDAIARITRALQTAGKAPGDMAPLATAVHDNRTLWTLLAAQVADADNGLPQPLRARIFYLFEFTAAHSRKVLNRQASVDTLVEVNMAIMRGLRGTGHAA